MRLLVLCKTSRSRLSVLNAIKERNGSRELKTVASPSDFEADAAQGGFDVGLVDYASLPGDDVKRAQTLKQLSASLPLVLLVSPRERGKATRLVDAGVVSGFVVRSAGRLEELPSALSGALERSGTTIAETTPIASGENMRLLFENSMVGIARTTPDGKILFANRALVHMLGFDSLEELQARNLQQEGFTDAQPRNEFLELIATTGEVRGYEAVWTRKDGTPIHVRESARVIRGVNGQILYIDDVIEDITEQKQASSSLREKIAALQALTGIDRDILAARQAGEILELVCRSAASLLKASKSVIVSTRSAKWSLEAAFGIQFPEELDRELGEVNSKGMNPRPVSFALDTIANTPRMMSGSVERENVRSILAEMLTVDAREQGILLVMDERPRAWTDEDRQLLNTLAGQAAIALEKARLMADAQRRIDEFAALHEVSFGLSSERDVQSILSMIVDSVSQTMQVPSAFIYLYNEKRDALDLAVSKGMGYRQKLSLEMGEGLAGRVAQTRKAMLVKDYRKWKHRIRLLDGIVYSSVLEAPMLFGGNLIGVLGVAEIENEGREFTEQDERLLSLFAAQAASAVHNANLFDAIQKSNQELNRLYRASNALIGAVSSNIEEICQKIAQIVVTEFRQSNCSLWLVSGESLSLHRMALAGKTSSEIVLQPLTLVSSGLIPKAIRHDQIINVPDVSKDSDYLPGWSAARSELVLPLKNGETVIGALDLQSAEPSAFSEDEVRVLAQFASRASLMVEHARLTSETEQRLQRLSILHTVDIAVASSLDLQVTLKVFLEQVTSQLRVDAADVLLLNPFLQILEFAAGRGFRGQGVRRVNLRIGEDAAGQAALDRAMVGVSRVDLAGGVISHPERIAGEDFISMYAFPLIARGKMKGVMELYFRRQFNADREWQNFVETLARQAAVTIDDAHLFEQLQQSYTELTVAYDSTIEGWARLLEMRKIEPLGHTRHVAVMVVELARRLQVAERELKHIHRGAMLHDIGKLAIPESILLKPGSLTEDEMAVIRTHPVIARDLLTSIDYLRPAAVIPYRHHEKWDGSGYPGGLAGEQIPLAARIFSVVDVWDTLLRDQAYRSAWSETAVVKHIRARAGFDFDPRVVEVFLALLKEEGNSIGDGGYDTI
jgi:PAS domain S-box-containing protein